MTDDPLQTLDDDAFEEMLCSIAACVGIHAHTGYIYLTFTI